jgi:hypothetical protein
MLGLSIPNSKFQIPQIQIQIPNSTNPNQIPQIVLAEKRSERDRFIVLDGKQRLLSLLQSAGWAKGKNNGFALSGLEVHQPIFFTSCF